MIFFFIVYDLTCEYQNFWKMHVHSNTILFLIHLMFANFSQ